MTQEVLLLHQGSLAHILSADSSIGMFDRQHLLRVADIRARCFVLSHMLSLNHRKNESENGEWKYLTALQHRFQI